MSSKLSYMHQVGDEPLLFTTLGDLLQSAANNYPDKIAIASLEHNRQLTFQELLNEVDKFAAGLRKLGMKKGDVLGLWAPNSIEWHVMNMACVRIGVILAALNPGNKVTEMKYCINKVGIKTIVCPLVGKRQNYYDILVEIAPELKLSEPGHLKCDNVPSLQNVILMIEDKKPGGAFTYKEVIGLATPDLVSQISQQHHLIQSDDPCYIQFSSGTTGMPKAAISTHFHAINSSRETGKKLNAHKMYHTFCMQVPFFHVVGLVCGLGVALHFGSTIIIPSEYYNPEANLRALTNKRCTIVYGTPTMYVDLINTQRQMNLDVSAEFAVTAGASCTSKLVQQTKDVLNIKYVKSAYGLTENCGPIAQSLPIEDDSLVMQTVGHVSNHLEVKVVDDDGYIVPMGEPGELCIRGHTTFLGYWNDEEKVKEIMGPDRWMKTGDQAILREDGYLTIVGRIKDVIIRGGENLFPSEIENYISAHPNILEVHVIGLPHERLGEEVCACIKLRNNSTLSQEDLLKFLKGKVAHFKIPTQIRIVDEFPKTTSGKVQKFKLRELYAEPGTSCT